IVEQVRGALNGEGYRLLSASNGREGLQLIREERPDTVLLNWGMPEMDGLAVSRAIRSDGDPAVRQTPILLLTWRSGSEETREGFDAGADDFITKPFTPALVRTRVREWVLRSRTPAK